MNVLSVTVAPTNSLSGLQRITHREYNTIKSLIESIRTSLDTDENRDYKIIKSLIELCRGSLNQIMSRARRENRELVVMGNRSPAFRDHDLLLREAPKFRSDPSLALIFKKFPNKNDPFCLDPLVIVRRSFLLEVGGRLQAGTLGELAILLAMEASGKNMKVSHV